MLGAPGAGKGTIGKRLSETLKIKHLSSGDIFRKLIKQNSEVGKKIEDCINNGQLIPDELAMIIFERKLLDYNWEKGIIYPRTKKQAEHLDRLLRSLNYKVDVAINIDVSNKLIIDRIVNRRICEDCGAIYNIKYGKTPLDGNVCSKCGGKVIQRADDNRKTVCDRLETYSNVTKPLLDYYEAKEKLYKLHTDENTSIDEAVEKALNRINEI